MFSHVLNVFSTCSPQVFTLLAPYCIAAFINSVALVAVLCFFVCLGYVALNETAGELENPFVSLPTPRVAHTPRAWHTRPHVASFV